MSLEFNQAEAEIKKPERAASEAGACKPSTFYVDNRAGDPESGSPACKNMYFAPRRVYAMTCKTGGVLDLHDLLKML